MLQQNIKYFMNWNQLHPVHVQTLMQTWILSCRLQILKHRHRLKALKDFAWFYMTIRRNSFLLIFNNILKFIIMLYFWDHWTSNTLVLEEFQGFTRILDLIISQKFRCKWLLFLKSMRFWDVFLRQLGYIT